jgi:glycosyltransferase involved in cell wall biosynthesis
MSAPKILYIITQADGGGAQKYVLTLAKHFGGIIAAGDEADELFKTAQNLKIPSYKLRHLKRNINFYHDIWALWEIRQLIKLVRPDIVHLNSTKAGFLGSIASAFLKTKAAPRTGKPSWPGVRVVFTAHGFRFLEPLSLAVKNFYLALEKVASSYRDFIITVSDFDRKAALQNKLINENKIQTIHNGLPPINFNSKQEALTKLNLKLNNQTKVIGTVANNYITKGVTIFEKASNLINSRGNFLSIVIGETFGKKNLINNGNFQLIGPKNNAATLLKAFDIFVLPSIKEGFPFVILEAMQAGLPIVATHTGGVPEALGNAGILVEPNNPKALADAIEYLIQHPDIMSNLSQKTLERSKLFSEEKMLSETKKVYDSLI